ncbi:hypothetical protein BJF79_22965 [Actinomadura sp. CNU-125]|nr:hypothetical protein BJF79_22965 [Actinomadura sp. CNU-125]
MPSRLDEPEPAAGLGRLYSLMRSLTLLAGLPAPDRDAIAAALPALARLAAAGLDDTPPPASGDNE